MRIAVAQMNSKAEDKEWNVSHAIDLIAEAAERGCDLVMIPEFFNVEYFPQYRDYQYLSYAEALDGATMSRISKCARAHKVWILATIFEKFMPGHFYDSAVLIDREGQRRGIYRKSHPAAVYSLEKIYFRYGANFPVFDVEGWPTGIMICYDTFFPEVARTLALKGAALILAPFAAPRHPIWREMHRTRAFENGCFLAVCNKVGREGEWDFAGESLVASPSGEILAMASGEEEALIFADLDRDEVDRWRQRYPMFRDRRPDLYTALVTPPENL